MRFLKLSVILVLIVSLVLVCSGFGLRRERVATLNDIPAGQKTMLLLHEDLSMVIGSQEISFKVILFFPEMRFCMFPYQITRI